MLLSSIISGNFEEMPIESEDFFKEGFESLEPVAVVEHFEAEEEAVVVVVTAPCLLTPIPLPSSLLLLLGEERCEVEVEEVEGGWCSLSMPLSCWSKLFDLVDDVEGWLELGVVEALPPEGITVEEEMGFGCSAELAAEEVVVLFAAAVPRAALFAPPRWSPRAAAAFV